MSQVAEIHSIIKKLKTNHAILIKENEGLKVEISDERERSRKLREENEELRKRNAFLECEPYRGPEFFQVLDEEKSSGLLS